MVRRGSTVRVRQRAFSFILLRRGFRCRWVAGADAVDTVEQKAKELLAQVDAYRDLSSSLAIDELEPAVNGTQFGHDGDGYSSAITWKQAARVRQCLGMSLEDESASLREPEPNFEANPAEHE
jgi:hypothetical protein